MTIHTDPTAQHAIYAPSSAHRWTVCTASAEALATLPDEEEGEAAAEGTAAHEEIERRLARIGDGKILPPDIDHPAVYGVALVVDFVRQLIEGRTVDDRIWIEQRVALTEQIWGRCDVAHWQDATGILTIVDYKNGQRAVDAEENEQLRIYAAASMFTHRLPVKWIRYVVVQPNDWRPFVPRVKQWLEPVDALYEWAEVVAAIPLRPKQFVAGDHCRNCPLFGHCIASRDLLKQFATVVAMGSGENVRSDQVALFLSLKKPIEDFFKGFEKSITKKALNGTQFAGMKLVTTRPHRKWKDEDAARQAVFNRFGIEKLNPPTPAQAEELGLDISGLADRPDGGPALAFANDKRPEWKIRTAADMFGSVVAAGTGRVTA